MARTARAEEEASVTQAVVVVGLPNRKMDQLTGGTPLCLFPFAGSTLLEYTLFFLESSGVDEAVLFCTKTSAEVEAHVNSGRRGSTSKMHVSVVQSREVDCACVGDVFRELDQRSILRGDFLFMTEENLAVFDLRRVFAEHLARREKDKSLVMTCVLQDVFQEDRNGEVFVTDREKKSILHVVWKRKGAFCVPLACTKKHCSFSVSSSLHFTGIVFCTPEILALFTENFDYTTLGSFLSGTLGSDILTCTIAAHVVEEGGGGYVERIDRPCVFGEATLSVLRRWTFPLVPDIVEDFGFHGEGVYCRALQGIGGCLEDLSWSLIGSGVTIGGGSAVQSSVVGAETEIGNSVFIRKAVIGKGCKIKSGCRVENCVIQDGQTVSQDVWCNCDISPERAHVCMVAHDGGVFTDHESDEEMYQIERKGTPDDTELYEMTLEAINNERDVENTVLELVALRLACNETNRKCLSIVCESLLYSTHFRTEMTPGCLKRLIAHWADLLKKFIDRSSPGEVLDDFLRLCSIERDLNVFFGHVAIGLYEEDVLEGEDVIEWYHSACGEGSEEKRSMVWQVSKFVEHLEESD
ncbi:MAG: translation initiation factor eIF2B subunit epsilon [Amphiamblys sp. WSBS2006]|nr:MAG: translation initiation factor eIF2B subunit epsilon [Amphiamblys sp. WSBS2006]